MGFLWHLWDFMGLATRMIAYYLFTSVSLSVDEENISGVNQAEGHAGCIRSGHSASRSLCLSFCLSVRAPLRCLVSSFAAQRTRSDEDEDEPDEVQPYCLAVRCVNQAQGHFFSLSLSLSLSRLFLSSVITRASGASLSVLGEEDGPAAEGEIGDGCRRGDGGER